MQPVKGALKARRFRRPVCGEISNPNLYLVWQRLSNMPARSIRFRAKPLKILLSLSQTLRTIWAAQHTVGINFVLTVIFPKSRRGKCHPHRVRI